jgi:DNA repair exonuclease SbcCD ATPase subunit
VRRAASYGKHQISLSNVKAEIISVSVQIEVLKLASSALSRSGFLGSIFDEILKEIEMRSNDLIGQVPNISSFGLKVGSTSTTKAGKVNRSISSKIFKDGREINVRAVSGGQQCGLELCTDLAVSESIRARSGSNLGWIMLDEAMDGLDIEPKRAALDVIKSKINGLIIVIDHATEIQEGFEKIVEVVYDGRESIIAE